ncbi:PKD domain-containing protein [Arthrobacter sp. UKPF54-2]|uniref:PKD domain-containing protein n=1 Tax=Arthrobacter sp. UKPF54-2 TaxID=2600159 RepID=UPI0011B13E47|nr:PKD domain-containing protein [Arthrobacter sp. UKPF54-2]QDY88907.1 PKD domain-containing protein [Arthrobacter sp. UKPF54-2]
MLLGTALALSLVLVGAPPSSADTAPADPASPSTPVTVSADALPTVQIDGVVWQQTVIGDTVYAVGKFATARPAGAPTGTQTTPRANILAYSLSTGELITGFTASLNNQALAVAASPDGGRLYVGGEFTEANGQPASRVVALDPKTGATISGWAPQMSSTVRAIVATSGTVYLGGLFSTVGSTSRSKLAAVRASNGTLLPWKPIAAGGRVDALVLSPDGSKLVVGGMFTTLNGSDRPGFGLGAVDALTGASIPTPANDVVRNAGLAAGVTSLSSDGTSWYGTAYIHFGNNGKGTLEGSFAANWSDLGVKWIDDCHGDSYSMFANDTAVYKAGHSHYCGNLAGFPETAPRAWHRGLAYSKEATGTLTNDAHGYPSLTGKPAPSLLAWYPDLDTGTATGQDQGPWSVTGNGNYVAMGGEFKNVNLNGQQGLVRFARSSIAPNQRGPRVTGANLTPTLSSPTAGTVRVRWQANWDQDNENLVYEVRRNGAVIATINQASTFWRRPGMSYLDTSRVPGQSYTYRIFVRDPFGNEARSDNATITVPGSVASPGNYAQQVLADKPGNYWRLGDGAGSTAVDLAGNDDLQLQPGAGFGATGALNSDADTAISLNGSPDAVASNPTLAARPNIFSTEAWIRTDSTAGGQIIGYGNSPADLSADLDRTVYMDPAGRIFFGVRPGGSAGTRIAINSTATFNDNQWHHVVASLGADGMKLTIDGVTVANRAATTTAWPFDGYWRVGGDSLTGWPNWPTVPKGQPPYSSFLSGQIDDVALYPTVLPLARIQAHYVASGRTVNAPPSPPVAAFTSVVSGLTATVDASTSSDANGPIAGYAWDFGDGSSGTGVTAEHSYAATGSYNVRLTVTDNSGSTASVTNTVTVTAPPPNKPPTAAFTSAVNNLTAAFDAAGSADADGTISGYAWDFGDGGTGTGTTASHSYAAAGSYQVTLTVTDDDGATGQLTRTVTVTAPPADTVVAADAFGRTATGGFGTADVGGAWTVAGGGSNFSVANGAGAATIGTAGASRYAYLNGVATAAYDGRITVSADKVPNGGGMFATLVGRRANNNEYRAKIKVAANGAVSLYLTKVVAGAETTIAGPLAVGGLTLAANDPVIIRLKLDGTAPTAVSGKVWRASAAEPAAWQLTVSDATAALQAAGAAGAGGYVSGSSTNLPVVLRLDNLNITAGGAAPAPNAAPAAAFSSTATGLQASFDGSGSTDTDGTVAGYAWNFGDGATGSGATASHGYAAAGTYQVTLTVTDNAGATGTVTRAVTVGGNPPAGLLAADTFGRDLVGSWGSADTGGAWTLAGTAANYTVAGGAGIITTRSGGIARLATLAGVSATATDLSVKVSQDKIATGGGTYVGAVGRKVGDDEYRAKLRIAATGAATLFLTRVSGGTETTLQSAAVAGLTVAANDQLRLRVQVTGTNPTTVRAKIWRDGAAEPATWGLTATDSTPSLQAAGGIGLLSYLWSTATNAPVAVRFDELSVARP